MRLLPTLLLAAYLASSPFVHACGLSWAPTVTDALINARLSQRLAVVVFTGSDWSPRSAKLDEEVLMNTEFAERFERHFALANADFPQRLPVPPSSLAANTEVATKFRITKWPTLLALRPDGTEFARLEFQEQPVASLIQLIDQWQIGYARETGTPATGEAERADSDEEELAGTTDHQPGTGQAVASRTFEVRGVVKGLSPASPATVEIAHEEIPGYMEAMTMQLQARDAHEIKGLQPGDQIRFRLNVTSTSDWIDQIRVLVPAQGPVQKAPAALKLIGAGEPLPDADLLDERGQPLKLSAYRGQALALTFIYTRCPLPTFCPLLNRNFQETQKLLTQDPARPKNWRLLTITIDPERDRPETLAALASALGADSRHWRFATGTLREITQLSVQCGLNFWDDRGLIQHNLRTIVVGPDGHVTRVLAENAWTPHQLAEELTVAAKKTSLPR